MADPRIQIHSYPWLDLIRGMAALEVFLSHSRTLFFKEYASGDPSIVKTIFYLLTGFSHQSVIIFFVLSGFFISRTVYSPAKDGRFSTANYLIDRFVRLWIVLIPALVLTFVVDKWGSHNFGGSPAYQGTIPYIGSPDQLHHLTLSDFLGNILFLQNFLVEPFGTNTPLWSLCNEFWYYILFPVIYFLIVSRAMVVKMLLSLLAIAIIVFVGLNITLYFLIWLMGFALVLLKEKFNHPPKRLVRTLFILAISMTALLLFQTRNAGKLGWISDCALGLLTSAIVFCVLNFRFPDGFAKKWISFLSEFSYSLYVIHMPLVIFLSSWLIGNPETWTYHYFAVYLAVIVAVLAITILWWFLFESRYKAIRAAIKAHHFFRSSHD